MKDIHIVLNLAGERDAFTGPSNFSVTCFIRNIRTCKLCSLKQLTSTAEGKDDLGLNLKKSFAFAK